MKWYQRLWYKFFGRKKPVVVIAPTPPIVPTPTGTDTNPTLETSPLYKELQEQYKLALPESDKWRSTLMWYVNKIVKHSPSQQKSPKERYVYVEKMSGVPWEAVAAIHGREASFKWNKHLHNGDPLNEVTSRVPRGRGPFATWEESAIDALYIERNKFPDEWTVAGTLDFLEKYNGLGYRKKRLSGRYPKLHSAYLWSGCEIYKGGGYPRDGHFSSSYRTKQIGCALILKHIGFEGRA